MQKFSFYNYNILTLNQSKLPGQVVQDITEWDPVNARFTRSLADNFIRSSNGSTRVLLLNIWLEVELAGLIEVFEYMREHVDHTILFVPEHPMKFSVYNAFDKPGVTIYSSTSSQDSIVQHAKYVYWPAWGYEIKQFIVDTCPDWLANYDPYAERPKTFDVLLGRYRLDRSWAYRYLHSDPQVNNKHIIAYQAHNAVGNSWYEHSNPENVNYVEEISTVSDSTKNFTVHDPELTQMIKNTTQKITHSVDRVEVNGRTTVPLSCIPDRGIYSKTAYSTVFETYSSDMIQQKIYFFTEKVFKPIMLRRMFLLNATGPDSLNNLKQLGFLTFDGIVDETYDKLNSESLEKESIRRTGRRRLKLMIKEMKKLECIPQREIFKEIEPIVEHNYQHLMSISLSPDEIVNSVCSSLTQ